MPGFVELATPNCMGVRFSYFEALSLTLQELEPEILFGLKKHGLNIEDVLFLTTVKDGCDGMGEVSVYKEKDFKMLPDKAFRFSFCIVKIQAEYDGKLFDVFTEPLPNSVRANRPLLESISDENNQVANVVCILPIENEREILMQNRMHVKTKEGWMFHKFSFFNSMVDDKKETGGTLVFKVVVQYIYVLYVMQINNLQKHYLGLFQLTGQFLNVQILLKFYVLTQMLCLKMN